MWDLSLLETTLHLEILIQHGLFPYFHSGFPLREQKLLLFSVRLSIRLSRHVTKGPQPQRSSPSEVMTLNKNQMETRPVFCY